jgi:LPS export ABC transporter protein LptC
MTKFFRHTFFWQAALVWSCLFVYSCENDPGDIPQNNVRKANIEEAYNIQSFLSQNGELRAKLMSPFMLRYIMDTSYLEFPRTLHVNFYDSSGKVESQLDALYGKYFETRSLVYLRDSVVVFNIKGDTLRTPDLWWDQNTKKFYTDSRVRIQRKGQRIIGGRGMEATQDLSNILIYHLESPSYITVPDSMMVD